MKKSIFFLSVLVFFAFAPQSFAQNDCGDNARSYVNANITTNGIRAITGAKMNVALNKIIDAIICRDSLATILQDSMTIEIEDDSILSFTIFGQTVKDTIRNVGGGGGGGIMDSIPILDTISVTYSEFYTLITGGNLQVGRTYIIIDFRTVYDQMDFDNSGSLKPTLTTKQGAIEEIWVYALSNNQIASRAYSKTYPNDQIQYDWTYNVTAINGSPAYGRISERIDEWNNRTDYDHRVIKFIRYDDGAGNFTVINDNGNASQEFLTFGNTYGTNTGEIIVNNYLGDYYVFSSFFGQEYPNNVFHATTLMFLNKLGLCYNNTWGDYNNNNTWGNVNNYNTWGDNNNGNTWGNGNNNNTWGNVNNYNTWGNGNNNNTWGNVNNYNTWGNGNNNNTWENNNSENTWGNNNNGNTWGNGNNNNTWGNVNNYNTWGNDNNYNNFENNNQNNTFTHSTFMRYLNINSNLQGKTIDDVTYPIVFNTNFKKEIIQASNGNYYIKTFDGTTDQYILIP